MKPSFPLQIYCCPWQVRPFCQEFENFLQNTLGEKTHYSVQTTEKLYIYYSRKANFTALEWYGISSSCQLCIWKVQFECFS